MKLSEMQTEHTSAHVGVRLWGILVANRRFEALLWSCVRDDTHPDKPSPTRRLVPYAGTIPIVTVLIR